MIRKLAIPILFAVFALPMLADPLTIKNTSLPTGTVNQAYSVSIQAAGGTPPYTFAITAISAGGNLAIDSSTGVLTGTLSSTPLAITLKIQVTDSASLPGSFSRNFFVNVWPTLTQYGGISSVPVPGCTPGYFQLGQIGTHWVIADPTCKVWPQRSVADSQRFILPAKLAAAPPNGFGGSLETWAQEIIHQFGQIGMNANDIYSVHYPLSSAVHFPYAVFWALTNDLYDGNRACPNAILPGDLTCGTLHPGDAPPMGATPAPLFICDGQNAHGYNCHEANKTYDVFNPNFALASYNGISDATHQDELYIVKQTRPGFATDPWVYAIDAGEASFVNALLGPGSTTIPNAGIYPDAAALVATSNFHFTETSTTACSSGSLAAGCGWGVTAPGQDLWSKYAWTCGKAGVDFGWGVGVSYLQHTYANIAALNTAWGTSGFYTSFCSDGGFGTGHGVLNEDGQGSLWFGTGTHPWRDQLGMNANLKTDLANFLQQFTYTAYHSQSAAVRHYDTNHLFIVGNFGGNGGAGVRPAVAKGMALAGVDSWVLDSNPQYMSSVLPILNSTYDTTCSVGHCMPALLTDSVTAVGDSTFYLCWNHTSMDGYASCNGRIDGDYSCSGVSPSCTGVDPGNGGQEGRGAAYAAMLPAMWTATGADGKQWNTGTVYWELADNTSEGNNWGLLSYEANPYNCNSATAVGGVDPWGYVEGEVAALINGSYNYVPPTTGFGCFWPSIAATNLSIMQLLMGTGSLTILGNPPDGVIGVPYNYPLSVAGGMGRYTWSVTAGSLPTGIMLDSSTGLLSGTPILVNTFTSTIHVHDSTLPVPLVGNKDFSITIHAVLPVSQFGVTLSGTGGLSGNVSIQ